LGHAYLGMAKTPEERTEEHRARMAAVQATPLVYVPRANAGTISAPSPFHGVWRHSTSVFDKIVADGWKPDLVKNTIYGAAIYLSREKWRSEHGGAFECALMLNPNEILSVFSSPLCDPGNTQNHVIWYLGEATSTRMGRNAGPGTSTQNRRIKEHFLSRGTKAIHFTEHAREVVAVYDPSCIHVLS
jgi:hypothetical protein